MEWLQASLFTANEQLKTMNEINRQLRDELNASLEDAESVVLVLNELETKLQDLRTENQQLKREIEQIRAGLSEDREHNETNTKVKINS